MSEPTESVTQLLRRCVLEGRAGPWAELLSKVDQIVRGGFLSAGGTPADLAEFLGWFPGWLFEERKLQALIRSLRAKLETGETPDADSQDAFASNYFARIVASAKADFFREKQPRERPVDPHAISGVVPTAAGRTESVAVSVDEIKWALLELPFEIRIPFRLKYYASVGPLLPDEGQWISDRSGQESSAVVRLVDEEFNSNLGRAFPLSSEFIGELLGILPSLTGKNTTVDQRISRRAHEYVKSSEAATNERVHNTLRVPYLPAI